MKTTTPARLKGVGPGLDQRLALYGVAAGAALAAGATAAQANVISLNLTGLPTADRTSFYTGTSGLSSLFFDVNAATPAAAVAHNSFAGADFAIHNGAGTNKVGNFRYASILGNLGNGIAGNGLVPSRFTTSNFVDNTSPPSSGGFPGQARLARTQNGIQTQGFAPGTTTYLGLRFVIGADTHLGWVNLTLNNDFTVTLNALGYESVPGDGAHVEPPAGSSSVPDKANSLVLLAIGAAGLLAFRSRQSQPA